MLNAIYEEDFLGFSYGFRPRRGPHDALDALVVGISSKKVNHVLDADIRSFFDSVSQEWLVRFLEHRVSDPRVLRLIRKWLKAGILENGVVTVSEQGTGQGSVASPLLANIYLHYVFDLWADRWRRREARGAMIIVRYADDIVVGFEHETDHPEKTRLIEFGRHAAAARKQRGLGKPETFDFLGFTFLCGKSRRGNFLLKRKTRRDRMVAKLKEVKGELRQRMHQPIPMQGTWLRQVVTGFFGLARSADKLPGTRGLPAPCCPSLAAHAAAAQPERRLHLETDREAGRRLPPKNPASFTPGRASASPLNTRGGSRMREIRTYGSVRGASSNGCPAINAGRRLRLDLGHIFRPAEAEGRGDGVARGRWLRQAEIAILKDRSQFGIDPQQEVAIGAIGFRGMVGDLDH